MELNGNLEQKTPKKNGRMWLLWLLGWIVFFPIPLTVLVARNKKLKPAVKYSIIAVIWISFFAIAAFSPEESENEKRVETEQTANGTREKQKPKKSNIKELSLSLGQKDTTLDVGGKYESYIIARVRDSKTFTPSDVEFFSNNPDVATVSFTENKASNYLYYEIVAVGSGETEVYAKSVDGQVESEHIKVTVPEPIKVESISINDANTNLSLDDSTTLKATILPNNATVKSITWSSSDKNVVTVNNDGKVTAVGGGTAIVTATAYGGITDSVQISVDASKRKMKVNVSRNRVDDNNIGDEWSFVDQINGDGSSKVSIGVGETIKLYSEYTESDANPDIGRASTTHKVTEEDIKNGFEVSMDVYVKENGGKNKGKSAQYVVTYKFSP